LQEQGLVQEALELGLEEPELEELELRCQSRPGWLGLVRRRLSTRRDIRLQGH